VTTHTTSRLPALRWLWVLVHRWAGLTLAVFLVIASVTGAILPFEESLNFASRPDIASTHAPSAGSKPLDGVTLAESVQRQLGVVVSYIPLVIEPDRPVRLFVAARPGAPALSYDVVWADPFTGAVKLQYKWGGLGDGPENIVPFLYSLHYGYVLGTWGELAFGIAALVWALDCFVGFYLTLPQRPRRDARHSARQWWERWRPAWKIRGRAGHKLTFDLHRAGGLWLWPMLFVIAWSAVCLILPQVGKPVMRAFGASRDFVAPALAEPLVQPPLDAHAALALGLQRLATLGARQGFSLQQPTGLSYDASTGAYTLYARTSLDRSDREGATALTFDARNGDVLDLHRPQGVTRADGFVAWINMLHMAEVFGLPYRIFMSLLGLGVAALSVTGVMIWMKRRSARLLSTRRELVVTARG